MIVRRIHPLCGLRFGLYGRGKASSRPSQFESRGFATAAAEASQIVSNQPVNRSKNGRLSALPGGAEDGGKKVCMRIARRIARSGIASRREADRLVASGSVTLNGELVTSPVVNVRKEDVVKVNGKALPALDHRIPQLWMVNKLRGELVTRDDPDGRQTLLGRLKKFGLPDTLMPVGRLDYNTEGLLLLTNDGELARRLEHPSTGLVRTYSVRVHGKVTEEKLLGMRRGFRVDGVQYRGMGVRVDVRKGRTGQSNTWLSVECTEGKNRQIRKICEHLYLKVNRLVRTRFGPFSLGRVRPGGIAKVAVKDDLLGYLDSKRQEGQRGRDSSRDGSGEAGKGATRAGAVGGRFGPDEARAGAGAGARAGTRAREVEGNGCRRGRARERRRAARGALFQRSTI